MLAHHALKSSSFRTPEGFRDPIVQAGWPSDLDEADRAIEKNRQLPLAAVLGVAPYFLRNSRWK